MLKRVDVAAYNVYKTAQDDTWAAGIQVLGLAEDGVGWALDENNESLITAEMREAVDAARAGIIDGSIPVHNYSDNNSCTS
jgi:basic membrane protein A